jgi:cytochrome d ubiquinol oxidase subunit I
MVAIGMALALLGLGYLVVAARGRLPRSPWFYRAVMAAGPLAVIALMAGWITTEVGRQPWIAWHVMRTSDAVTQASGLPIAYGVLALVYLGLIAVVVWLLRRLARRPAETGAPPRERVAAAGR